MFYLPERSLVKCIRKLNCGTIVESMSLMMSGQSMYIIVYYSYDES
jgi:hypothetical protein